MLTKRSISGMSQGGEAEWDKLWQAYVSEQEPQEKSKLRSALAAVREPWILNRFVHFIRQIFHNFFEINSQTYFRLRSTLEHDLNMRM